MHKIHAKEFVLDDFSHDHLLEINVAILSDTIDILNAYRDLYNEETDDKLMKKKYWQQMIQLLPSSYNQMRTVTMSYANAANIIKQRSNHKLMEWRYFCNTLLDELPYLKEIIN